MEELINSILTENKDKTNELLTSYLKIINKSEYLFLIKDLIKLSELQEEIGYTTPILTLLSLKTNRFNLNIKDYIIAYKETTNQEEKDIYIDIIKNSEKLNKPEELKQNLLKAGIEYINSIKDEVKTRGLLVLDSMDKHERWIINKSVEQIDKIEAFTLGNKNKSRIVLRWANTVLNRKAINGILEKAKSCYNQGNFEEAIKYYRKIVGLKKLNQGVATFVYIKLGLAYTKLKKNNLGVDYLTVASYYLKPSETKKFILDTIEKLKQKEENIEIKPYVLMTEEEFMSNKINIIKELIKENFTIEEIGTMLNLNQEQKLIALITQAEFYYENEFYTLGDEILNFVEEIPNKTETTRVLLTRTRKNKIFLKNRRNYTLTI